MELGRPGTMRTAGPGPAGPSGMAEHLPGQASAGGPCLPVRPPAAVEQATWTTSRCSPGRCSPYRSAACPGPGAGGPHHTGLPTPSRSLSTGAGQWHSHRPGGKRDRRHWPPAGTAPSRPRPDPWCSNRRLPPRQSHNRLFTIQSHLIHLTAQYTTFPLRCQSLRRQLFSNFSLFCSLP